MSSSEARGPELSNEGIVEQVTALRGLIDGLLAHGIVDGLPAESIQEGLTAFVRLYAAQLDAGASYPPFAEGVDPSATAVLQTVSAMLEAVNVEVFELGLFKAWSGR